MVTFVVTGDGTGSFQTVNFDLFNQRKRNYLSLSLYFEC